MEKKENNCRSKKFKIWSPVPKGARQLDRLADWPSVVIQLDLTKCFHKTSRQGRGPDHVS
jgi:hypothetical protein